jgi:hypothetical protein
MKTMRIPKSVCGILIVKTCLYWLLIASVGSRLSDLDAIYKIKTFNHGLQIADLSAKPIHTTIQDIETLITFPEPAKKDIPGVS